jgi:hypothetical protein
MPDPVRVCERRSAVMALPPSSRTPVARPDLPVPFGCGLHLGERGLSVGPTGNASEYLHRLVAVNPLKSVRTGAYVRYARLPRTGRIAVEKNHVKVSCGGH